MALSSWFSKTRKFGIQVAKTTVPHVGLTRKLESVEGAAPRIFGQWKNSTPGKRDGRAILRRMIQGPALTRWYPDHLRTIPGFWYYKSDKERYALAKNSYMRTKGKVPPKKGAGKKALKRMADAKKAAAKAKK